jgi:ABC-2 type transport system permease protein
VASFLPFASPFVMFTRTVISSVPPLQLGIALAVNLAAAIGCFVLAGQVYRVGLLMYGKLPSLRQVLIAIRSR